LYGSEQEKRFFDWLWKELHKIGGSVDLLEQARSIVQNYVEEQFDKSDVKVEGKPEFEVYVVWFCKTLQNWKALVSTTLPDQMYYEVTHNGDEGVTYLDAYKKFNNVVIQDSVE